MADPSIIKHPERFWAKVKPFTALDACWQWIGAHDRYGYGKFQYRTGRRQRANFIAHRVAYYLLVGESPDLLDHLCRNRACVNPDHLEPVTPAENSRRGRTGHSPSATHCINGHERNDENTYYRKDGRRGCRACNRDRLREFHRRNPDKQREYNARYNARRQAASS